MEIKLTPEQIKALQAGEDITIKAPCQQAKPFLQAGQPYWRINIFGIICPETAYGQADDYESAYIYKTKQEAEQALELAQAKQRLKQAIAEANDGWTPDWDNTKVANYLFTDGQIKISIDRHYRYKYYPNWMYIKSPNVAKQILADHKADIELILSE